MSRRDRILLLGALSGGALLVGVELLITAVALPAILTDLAGWTELRRASWIVNGYALTYIATMPLAGRAADRYGLPRLFILALAVFAIGSVLSGLAQTLDQLIAARVVQGIGAGAVVPLATAGASHLFEGPSRARALGVVGAFTFLGMALGPFAGATILQSFQLGPALGAAGLGESALVDLLAPSWRWIFYLGAPLALLAMIYTWAAAPAWPRTPSRGRLDVFGASLFTAALAAGLLGLTRLGELDAGFPGPVELGLVALVLGIAAITWNLRARDPFLDLRLLRDRTFTAAVVLSLLTGYALATAIIGAAVFVDRVRYGGPNEQQIVLGALALAMAVGALGAGFAMRYLSAVLLSLAGLALSMGGLLLVAGAGPETDRDLLLGGFALFGLGFGLTVTPRSTAAVEALGKESFGIASAGVTVARMAGMAVGLAVLTGFGSRRIESLSVVLVDPVARDAVLPPALRGRPLEDGLVVDALEAWASLEAASILSGLFLVATAVLLAAVLPTLLMGNIARRRLGERIMRHDGHAAGDEDGSEAALAL
ncbi:MAG: MFS transporter [Chloroflexota bacterium]|nr:MFS transporter [Chloroflexota bacterium]